MTPTSPWARGHIQGRAGGGTMGTPRLGAPVGMNRVWGRLAGALVVVAAAVAIMGSAPPLTISELHVCADPYNMPFSDDHEQGFENKIANVVARDLNARVVNYWWPHRRGFVRNSLSTGSCDVIIGAPVGWELVATATPYYRSTYYFVYRADRGLAIHSLDDTILKHLRIGVNIIGYDYTNTPPARDRKSTRLNSSHGYISYAVFCLKKKKKKHTQLML